MQNEIMLPFSVAQKEIQTVTDLLSQRLLLQAGAVAELQAHIAALEARLTEIDPGFLNPEAATDNVQIVAGDALE